ncbi:hypothetical protein MMAGJ_21150 [Mycolicibacterium mageritense]|uniref:DUF3558 domain-containing protein n=1 Tax=Mycolicibacterium mageritense TaxID=53462 RepID=A0ABM7HQM6_MYCME|nr:hypothetical protein MMAGJ_21150 [Mycolicibacterium mageritense]
MLAVAATLAVTGCTSGTPAEPSTDVASPPNPVFVMNRYSAGDLAAMITESGLPLPHAHDVSRRDCPVIRCTDKIESDTVSVMTFRSSGVAELHAGLTDHSFQLFNVVMVFNPTVNADQKRAYEDVVTHAIQ